MRRFLLYGLFFLSGASALVYELVWQRLLNLVFGVSTLSVSTVLAAFMGGLALGGLAFGRWADRTRNPLRLYAGVEAAIGLTALLVPPGFALLTALYTGLYARLQPGPGLEALIRFALSMAVLTGPAALIGGTMPIMGRLAARRADGLPSAFSLLYAVNTLGAVLGAALTGFVFLHYIGMQATLFIAVAVNGVVALTSALLGRKPTASRRAGGVNPLIPHAFGDGTKNQGADAPHSPAGPAVWRSAEWLALGCAALTGAASMGFEVASTRILGILTSNSAYGFALILTVLLLGLGLGGFLQACWMRRPGDPWRRLALCQWVLAGLTLAGLSYFKTTPEWLEHCYDGKSVAAVFLGELALTAAAVFLPAVCMGLSLPLLVAAVASERERFGADMGRLYAVNALGCVVGPFLAGFILIPRLGIQATTGLVVAASALVGLVAWLQTPRPGIVWRAAIGAAAGAAALVAWMFLPAGGFVKSAIQDPEKLLYYAEGDNGTVTVVEEPNRTRRIMVDGQPVAGTSMTSVIDQKMLAHLPLLLHPAPRRALTVGFGSGGTSYSMGLHGVDVDCVEIEAKVPAAAANFESQNHGVLRRPRYRLVLDDARGWLRVAPARYDAVVTDCTNLQYRSNGDLYTVEYFRLMKDRLTADGVAAAWVPADGIRDADLKTLIRSFREVFPHTSVWYMNSLATDFLIVVGTPATPAIDLDAWARRMRQPEVAADLAEAGLDDPCRLTYTLLTAEEQLDKYLGAGPLNTDDRPVLSYSTYGAGFQNTTAENLIHLMACRVDAARFAKHAVPGDVMPRQYAASNELVLGHVTDQMGNHAEAAVHYLRGSRLLPEDADLRELLRMSYLRLGARPRAEAAE